MGCYVYCGGTLTRREHGTSVSSLLFPIWYHALPMADLQEYGFMLRLTKDWLYFFGACFGY
jgi:hypothetical protein